MAMPLVSFSSGNDDHQANLRRLVAMRWLLIGLAAVLSLLVSRLLGIALPQPPILGIIGLMAAMNFLSEWRLRRGGKVTAADVFSHLVFDTASLSALIFFSGGVTNPMISLLLPPVAFAALALSAGYVVAISILAIGTYSLLLMLYLPLPIIDPAKATRLHLFGMWLSFALSAMLIAWFIVRMSAMIRQRDAELARAREQALRDERVLALGTLAAGAAHELGTPLGTMALIAGELAGDGTLPAEVRQDLAVLREQIAACKGIITGLSQRAGAERLENIARRPVDGWLGELRLRWHALWPARRIDLEFASPGPAPAIPADPRLEQALQNLVNNSALAAGEAGGPVVITAAWRSDRIIFTVRDSGPGFPPDILALAGRAQSEAHAHGQGIGLLLTRAAIEQLGGSFHLENPPGGGALARIELPLTQQA